VTENYYSAFTISLSWYEILTARHESFLLPWFAGDWGVATIFCPRWSPIFLGEWTLVFIHFCIFAQLRIIFIFHLYNTWQYSSFILLFIQGIRFTWVFILLLVSEHRSSAAYSPLAFSYHGFPCLSRGSKAITLPNWFSPFLSCFLKTVSRLGFLVTCLLRLISVDQVTCHMPKFMTGSALEYHIFWDPNLLQGY